jgi:hypothetical protein
MFFQQNGLPAAAARRRAASRGMILYIRMAEVPASVPDARRRSLESF